MPGPLLHLAATALLSAFPSDTGAFPDTTTRDLVYRAMDRHRQSDQEVVDYTAALRYRFSFGFGKRRWALIPPAAIEEQEARVQWHQPNDIRVDIIGRRARARLPDVDLNSGFDRPWFFPRGLGDSVRIFGTDFPGQAAIHPLAIGADRFYRYSLTDSIQISSPTGEPLRLMKVTVEPRRTGLPLTVGYLWLDAASAEVVRFSFRFIGTDLWIVPDSPTAEDSSDARKANRLISRVLSLSMDLEYSLQERRYWMPFRQVVSGRVELPWVGDLVIPFQATTTFDNYEINQGRPVAFQIPIPEGISDDSIHALTRARRDSLREERRRRRRAGEDLPGGQVARDYAGRWPNGRYELHRPPADSLKAYDGWGDSLSLEVDAATDRQVRDLAAGLEAQAARLSDEYTGRSRGGFLWERIGDYVRFNRVQGHLLGGTYRRILSGDGATTADATARFGVSDHRVVGELNLRREGLEGRWTLSGFRQMRSSDPFARPNTLGNSLNGIFAGHDDAEYYLAEGGSLGREHSLGYGIELTTTLWVERQSSVRSEGHSWISDALGGTGDFPVNPPVRGGTYAGFSVVVNGVLGRGSWQLGGDALGNDGGMVGRAFGMVRQPLWVGRGAAFLTVRGGVATSEDLPQQMFRLGGLATVRGFDYGTRRGQAFWSAQLDWPLTRGLVQPVAFIDAGQAGGLNPLFDSRALVGTGAGLSFLGGLLRFDLSHPITSGGSGLRFDISMRPLVP